MVSNLALMQNFSMRARARANVEVIVRITNVRLTPRALCPRNELAPRVNSRYGHGGARARGKLLFLKHQFAFVRAVLFVRDLGIQDREARRLDVASVGMARI
jgi:hypothetical protein